MQSGTHLLMHMRTAATTETRMPTTETAMRMASRTKSGCMADGAAAVAAAAVTAAAALLHRRRWQR